MLESGKFSIKLPEGNQPHNIKVIGVGGGGNNAVDYMFKQGIDGVDFLACNTDMQVLEALSVPYKVQLGRELTDGEGAGGRPEIGREAAEESVNEIRALLKDGKTKLAFIAAGMGGGTGTGAAPVIARVCREIGIISVGVVTLPFTFEGSERLKKAKEGIELLRQNVDSLIVICNDKIKESYSNLNLLNAFGIVNEVLCDATRAITSLVTLKGLVNLDFADVCSVLRNGGDVVIAQAKTAGEDRLQTIIDETLKCTLLEYNQIYGTKRMLMAFCIPSSATDVTITVFEELGEEINTRSGGDVESKLGLYVDDTLQDDEIKLVIIASDLPRDIIPEPKSINVAGLGGDEPRGISVSMGGSTGIGGSSVQVIPAKTAVLEDFGTASNSDTSNVLRESVEEYSNDNLGSAPVLLANNTQELDKEEVIDEDAQLALLLERGRRDEEHRREQLRGYSTNLDLDFDNMDNPFYRNSYVEKARKGNIDNWGSPISGNHTELRRGQDGNIIIDRGNKFVDGNTPD